MAPVHSGVGICRVRTREQQCTQKYTQQKKTHNYQVHHATQFAIHVFGMANHLKVTMIWPPNILKISLSNPPPSRGVLPAEAVPSNQKLATTPLSSCTAHATIPKPHDKLEKNKPCEGD